MDNTSTASSVKATGSTSDQASSRNREYFSRVYRGVKSCFGGNLHPKPEHISALQEELVSTKKQYDDACDQLKSLTKALKKKESQATRVQKLLEKQWRGAQLVSAPISFLTELLPIQWRIPIIRRTDMRKESENITFINIVEKNRLRAQIEDLREEKFQVETNLRNLNIDFSSVKTENVALKDRIGDLTSQLQTSFEKEKDLRDLIQLEVDNSLAHQRDINTLTAHLAYSKENVVTLEVRLAFMGARLREEQWTRKRMEGDIISKDILLDELWSEVYSPTDKSIVVRELRQARGENANLQNSLNRSNAKVADLYFKVATLTPLPADEDEVEGASVGDNTLVADENEDFQPEDEVTKTLAEKDSIIEELSDQLALAMDDAIAAESELLEVEERCSRLENEKEILSFEVAKGLVEKDAIIEDLSEKVEELSEHLSLAMDDAISAESGLLEVEERFSTLENEKEIVSKELESQQEIIEDLTSRLSSETRINEQLVAKNQD
ncbi:hypothetical protein FRC02_002743 [Tulasnella sp. 418]|nr:hypothetical protein FRC02_002743 [Tulasnella sp. 418]